MKIIKKVKPWSAEVICTGEGYDSVNSDRKRLPCGSSLEVEAQDIFRDLSRGLMHVALAFKCPCCKCLTAVSEKKLKMTPAVIAFCENQREEDIDKAMSTDETFGV